MMNFTRIMAGATALALGLAPIAVAAQTVASADPASILAAMKAKGYRASLSKNTQGDPLIRSSAVGTDFLVIFSGCESNRNCTTVQFYSEFNTNGVIGINKMNEWNRSKRFARAYLDDEKDPCVEMDVYLAAGGMSPALFGDYLDIWASTIVNFKEHLN